MARNFYFPSVTTRLASGAQPPAGPHIGADTRANSNQLPDLSSLGRANSRRLTAAAPFIPADPPLKFGKVTQALIDVGALLVAALVVSLTGIGAGVSLFILFFVDLHW